MKYEDEEINFDTDHDGDDDNDDLFMVDLDTFDLSDDDDDDDFQEKKQTLAPVTNKPKLIGKHSLAYDTIFKGKRNEKVDEYESEHIIKNAGGSLDIKDDLLDNEESRSNIDYFRDTRLKKEIFRILTTHTDIDFNAPRRKPSRSDFNAYFQIILNDLKKFGYTKTEIFIELSGYFSDNIWNIFLLLDNKYSNIVIDELKDKFGLSDIDKIDFL
jgi:hypothetical protein